MSLQPLTRLFVAAMMSAVMFIGMTQNAPVASAACLVTATTATQALVPTAVNDDRGGLATLSTFIETTQPVGLVNVELQALIEPTTSGSGFAANINNGIDNFRVLNGDVDIGANPAVQIGTTTATTFFDTGQVSQSSTLSAVVTSTNDGTSTTETMGLSPGITSPVQVASFQIDEHTFANPTLPSS